MSVATHLRVALISGGMYDGLYARIPDFERSSGTEVEVVFRGAHPELNARLAEAKPSEYDLVSTHSKYAPSQLHLLAPVTNFDTRDFFPAVLELARIGGTLFGVPRNIDLRLLHFRTDLIRTPPSTWDELRDRALSLRRDAGIFGYGFPGRESGLFGTFVELVESAGGRIFNDSLRPELNNEAGQWALGVIRDLYQGHAAPTQITTWHYDDVHASFRSGQVAMVADWPGFYGSYRAADSPVRDRFAVCRMPSGPAGRVCCYAGSHTFALTKTGALRPEAHELLRFLTAPEQQQWEAEQGSVPVRISVMQAQQADAQGQDARRLELLSQSVANDLLIPPKTAAYPEFESILWHSVQAAMIGQISIPDALRRIESQIAEHIHAS